MIERIEKELEGLGFRKNDEGEYLIGFKYDDTNPRWKVIGKTTGANSDFWLLEILSSGEIIAEKDLNFAKSYKKPIPKVPTLSWEGKLTEENGELFTPYWPSPVKSENRYGSFAIPTPDQCEFLTGFTSMFREFAGKNVKITIEDLGKED